MDTAFEPFVTSLEAAATAILALSPSHEPTLNATHGWNQVGLTLADVAGFSSRLASDIREYGADNLSPASASTVATVTAQFEQFKSTSFPQFWGGNGSVAVPSYIVTIEGLRARLMPFMPKYVSIDPRTLPAQLAKKITRITSELDAVIVDKVVLAEKINLIDRAYQSAEDLPEALVLLDDAKKKIEKLESDAATDSATISANEKSSVETLAGIKAFSVEAEKLVAQCEEAYRVTTSKGLAGAFDQRAKGLSQSMQLWVVALVISLTAAAILGSHRVELLTDNLGETDPKWGVIWLNLVLSFLSVGAPLWFAWVATKQIGQRFRLAEDYGYKASIAKAYEGYRREAAKLDPAFEARLFGSSLSRLEEAPLRLVETNFAGSPLHELLNSQVPGLKDKTLQFLTEVKSMVGVKPDAKNTSTDLP